MVLEEADEAHGWLLILVDMSLLTRERADSLIKEASELTAIFNASYHTAKRRLDDPNQNQKITKSANQ